MGRGEGALSPLSNLRCEGENMRNKIDGQCNHGYNYMNRTVCVCVCVQRLKQAELDLLLW